jgi:Tfp pilus assembly PilM family ATPase
MKKRHYYTYPPTALELSQHWFAFVTIKKTKDELNIQKSIVKQIREDFIPYSLGNITTLKSEEIKRFISGIFNEYTISLKRLSLAIPDSLAYIFVFQDIPENTRSKEAITEFIRWKVEKKLPFNFKEAIIGFQCFIDFNEKNLLAVISPANIIRQFEEIFSSLGIHVGLIVPSSFALINFYHHLLSHRNDNKEYLFINLSDYYISFFIIQGQRPILFRTKNLINKEEVRKGDYSFLIEQVRFTLLYYQNRFQKEEDLSIYLGGVSPAVRNFKSLIESTLDLKVDIITPSANKKLKVFSEESEERIYFLSSAIGAALGM